MLAVAAKLLVPVGYMPAALADGGPFMLCGSEFSAATAPASQSEHGSHGHESRGPESHVHGTAAHDHGEEPAAGHHEWERCSLGGLASLAALSVEWHFGIESRPPEGVAVPEVSFFSAGAPVAFRSRAPPVAVS
jgi:hypothetical protein